MIIQKINCLSCVKSVSGYICSLFGARNTIKSDSDVNKSTMKGGREDVDTPFWSWGTGLLGTFWVNNVDQNDRGKAYVPEHFPRETYFWMGFRRSEAFRTKATSIPIQILHETIFFMYLVVIQVIQLLLKNIEIYWNIVGQNLGTSGPNDGIFWLH